MSSAFEIIPFDPKFISHFERLNVAWLEEYFVVEPYDRLLLQNCKSEIIDKGGFIFFGQINNAVVATVALLKTKEESVYEIGKMAVEKQYQGKGYGSILLQFLIDFSEKQNWKKLILYSSTTLENSIYLYRKFGFLEIPLEENKPYQRGNIKMERAL